MVSFSGKLRINKIITITIIIIIITIIIIIKTIKVHSSEGLYLPKLKGASDPVILLIPWWWRMLYFSEIVLISGVIRVYVSTTLEGAVII